MEPKISITVQPAPLDVITTPEFEAASRRMIATHAAAPELLYVLKRILAAHDSGNNGAVMGEAILCRHFAETARAAIAKAEAR